MAEAKQIGFSYQELAELMVRKAEVKEGLWGIYMKFGIAGVNVGQSPEDVSPAAIVPVLEIGLQRFEEPSRLTVDAAEIAGAGKAKSAKATAKATKAKA
jgi:hypothetical protein